jgi:hypothetical protein
MREKGAVDHSAVVHISHWSFFKNMDTYTSRTLISDAMEFERFLHVSGWLITGLSTQDPGFNPRPVCMGFVVDTLSEFHVLLPCIPV